MLTPKQIKFTLKIAELIVWAYANGYEFTLGDAYAKRGHSRNSFHYRRLAQDLNLFIDGEYIKTTEAHRPIGDKWKKMGGTWGGDFKRKDGNHYSWGEK